MMLRVDERRIEGREVRSPLVKSSFESTQGRVDTESTHDDDDRNDLDPPGIPAQSAAESRLRRERRGSRHRDTSEVGGGEEKNRIFQTKVWGNMKTPEGNRAPNYMYMGLLRLSLRGRLD